jgi:prepilin-type N-terminal cleavage/methylation domain-containing protein
MKSSPCLKSFFPFSSKGFTLVEMAIVLVIIGIAMALGLPLLSQLSKNVKYSDSRDIVKGAIDSVEGWAAGGSLQQLPDLRNTTSDFRNIVKSPSDAFGQPLIYVYDYNSSTFTSNQLCGMRMTSINLSYTVGTTTYSVNNVAFVVLSPGDDYKINSTITASNFIGANNATPVTYTNQAIPSPGGTANNATITINADASNDIVQWVTMDELRTKIGCQSTQLTIVNNELPYGYNNTPYTANIYANGGVPNAVANAGKYNWCVQQSSAGNPFAGMSYYPVIGTTVGASNVYINANCQGSLSSWTQADYIQLTGTPILVVAYPSNSTTYYISVQSNNTGITPGTNSANWQVVSFTPAAANVPNYNSSFYYPSGSNTLTIYVSDNGNNTASKTFTFTVNPL